MVPQLPEEFLKRMEKLLGREEYVEFLDNYGKERRQALRVNTAKISVEEFQKQSPFSLEPVPWANQGFYYGAGERPGLHPYHEAGLYYMQEPSAMAVAALADARPGERVLDLCAAPGGKTTQLAAAMKGKGLLVANEIHPARAKILSQNVERMGIPHAVVTNESPQGLSHRFPKFFDRVVVDAPCSGEGMFRKEEQACLQWSMENVRQCAQRQQEILEEAASMLRPGGRLVYSTCTFAPEENEGSVSGFLQRHPEFSVEKVPACTLFSPGRPEWVQGPWEVTNTLRLWPHRIHGEGHFLAILGKDKGEVPAGAEGTSENRQKDGSGSLAGCERGNNRRTKRAGNDRRKGSGETRRGKSSPEQEALQVYQAFAEEALVNAPQGVPLLFGEQLYLLPEQLNLSGLKVLRPGLHVGTLQKNRFVPAHALALALGAEDARFCCDLPGNSQEVRAYLRGETLALEGEKGWCLVLVDGYSLGWGKAGGGMLKNHYPKGLRKG
ncbi:MAG: NOL1/NOP2/sun family putative RNA methylase [Lachnospiraceae bacterium]|jgi:NOL1/NOP2/sun family putative RNA methylase|nr:NOL1/NOP2/sun family putative RNA methylase [Lachnospiraceae bacterium]